jgi:membrane-bound metal-dependent hydrolase YbcI (DUF457 family)
VVPGGPLDGTAHLLTTLLIFWALGRRASGRLLASALVASVAIDFDHIPARLGTDWLTAGTSRPYSHSLLSIATVLLAAVLWRRRRDLLIGGALGLTIHFWRDLAEPASGVPLLFPVSYRSFTLPYRSYVGVMIAVTGIAAYRARSQSTFAAGETLSEEAGR